MSAPLGTQGWTVPKDSIGITRTPEFDTIKAPDVVLVQVEGKPKWLSVNAEDNEPCYLDDHAQVFDSWQHALACTLHAERTKAILEMSKWSEELRRIGMVGDLLILSAVSEAQANKIEVH